jgi:predicted nucleic acid-binding protein
MIVVSDTSPLNYLVLIDYAHLLPAIFGQVFTAPAVLVELAHERTPDVVRTWAATPPPWLVVQEPSNPGSPSLLGPGETAAIALAEELHADWLLIDERDGRDEARRRGLKVIGTLAVLDQGAERNLIDLPQALERLKNTNFFVADKLLEEILRRDQERKADIARRAQEQNRDPKPEP